MKSSEKHVHFAHGLFASAINAEIGGSLLSALPMLLENGDIKVSVRFLSIFYRVRADTHELYVITAKPRRGPLWRVEWYRRRTGALEE